MEQIICVAFENYKSPNGPNYYFLFTFHCETGKLSEGPFNRVRHPERTWWERSPEGPRLQAAVGTFPGPSYQQGGASVRLWTYRLRGIGALSRSPQRGFRAAPFQHQGPVLL